MVDKKTPGRKEKIDKILDKSKIPLSLRDITFEILGTRNPQLVEYSNTYSSVKHYIKMYMKNGILKKTPQKVGFTYSLIKKKK